MQQMKFDISRLKGKLGRMRDRMEGNHIPYKLTFFIMGIVSTIWFLVRVIPKPSRATYPCMKVAAPFMSGFVTYLLAVAGLTAISRRVKRKIINVRYGAIILLLTGVIVAMAIVPSNTRETEFQTTVTKTGPEDGPNQPIGEAKGIFPGRVVWVWNPDATNEKFEHNNFDNYDWFVSPQNNNPEVIARMFREGVLKLTGKKNIEKAWDEMFRYFNERKINKKNGYTKGEKIFIKINQGQSRWLLSQADKDNGFAIPHTIQKSQERIKSSFIATETGPYAVLELLRELVDEVGVDQADISIGDPMCPIWAHNYDVWVKEFPNVKYLDKFSTKYGRTLTKITEKPLVYYSDKTINDKLYDVIENADYMITMAVLKSHGAAGVSLTAKSNFGNIGRATAGHLHYSHVANRREGTPSNTGYHKYRVFVDLMGSKYLGQNTLFWFVEGLFGGGASEIKGPVKYFMPPFNNDWCNSMFMSLDPVAIESVGYDFLRAEWDGVHKHDAVNNEWESMPNVYGVDDYMHQAADTANWPQGIIYDPDNSGKPIPVLGVHEHWNNPVDKQYSRNLGTGNGIELVSIPENLVKNVKGLFTPVIIAQTTGTVQSFGEGITAKKFYSSTIDEDNTVWFLTESGIISFDGAKWALHDKNHKVASTGLKGMVYDFSSYGPELWLATPRGATVASLPVDARSGATTYYSENSKIISENVLAVAVGKNELRWFGTDKGISAFKNRKWLTNSYTRKYPEGMFQDYPITSMATSINGDSLYVGTLGGGVLRVYRNDVDAVSGASEYAAWGPILMPSDSVYSIHISADGTQWFGTDKGVAKHTGYNTLEGWIVFTSADGLADDFVQAINSDAKGTVYFGTKNGLSAFDGTKWTSYKTADGLASNNILTISVDKKDCVWLGTDNGVTSYKNGKFTIYR